jgi:hypothetical protein
MISQHHCERSEAIQLRRIRQEAGLLRYARNEILPVKVTVLPHVEDKTGDDEHCRHRQHLRNCSRGRPFGGFLHAVLPRLGHPRFGRDSSLRGERQRQTDIVYSEHPTTSIRLYESPLSEYRRLQDRRLMRRLFDSKVTRFARPWAMEIADQKIGKL